MGLRKQDHKWEKPRDGRNKLPFHSWESGGIKLSSGSLSCSWGTISGDYQPPASSAYPVTTSAGASPSEYVPITHLDSYARSLTYALAYTLMSVATQWYTHIYTNTGGYPLTHVLLSVAIHYIHTCLWTYTYTHAWDYSDPHIHVHARGHSFMFPCICTHACHRSRMQKIFIKSLLPSYATPWRQPHTPGTTTHDPHILLLVPS